MDGPDGLVDGAPGGAADGPAGFAGTGTGRGRSRSVRGAGVARVGPGGPAATRGSANLSSRASHASISPNISPSRASTPAGVGVEPAAMMTPRRMAASAPRAAPHSSSVRVRLGASGCGARPGGRTGGRPGRRPGASGLPLPLPLPLPSPVPLPSPFSMPTSGPGRIGMGKGTSGRFSSSRRRFLHLHPRCLSFAKLGSQKYR